MFMEVGYFLFFDFALVRLLDFWIVVFAIDGIIDSKLLRLIKNFLVMPWFLQGSLFLKIVAILAIDDIIDLTFLRMDIPIVTLDLFIPNLL